MDIHDSVAVVTGANRGLGRHFAEQLLERGAARSTRPPATLSASTLPAPFRSSSTREEGSTSEEASKAAGLYMEGLGIR